VLGETPNVPEEMEKGFVAWVSSIARLTAECDPEKYAQTNSTGEGAALAGTGDRGKLSGPRIKIEPSALDSLVPCFLLQPIVENAIRHGIAHCESNGLVEASARRDGNLLRLEVRDTGQGFNSSAKPGNGIGLKNTRERLAHFYDKTYDMRAGPLEMGGFEVAIAIPYERS
jgi:signal transduction histidine kinase